MSFEPPVTEDMGYVFQNGVCEGSFETFQFTSGQPKTEEVWPHVGQESQGYCNLPTSKTG